uniref:Reverse transcriptase RNase H-like domain-containing protein n=1 Tax=Terrapene triunguis TaxID=2587831 RepID=A0A674JCD7_9SAUR
MEAPALGLPDISKPFQLYVHERKGVALGMLTQLLGAWKRPVAYFSKQLDQVSKGWPACLRAVAATALVLGEAEKLTLGGIYVLSVCCSFFSSQVHQRFTASSAGYSGPLPAAW